MLERQSNVKAHTRIVRPSWDEAPTWAQWLAQDSNGEWFWFEFEPSPVEQRPPEVNFWLLEHGNFQRARVTPVYEDWNLTLEKRA